MGAREDGDGFWIKRNAEGSEVAEEDAEEDGKNFKTPKRQGRKVFRP
jgi:hypothetical protein